MKKFDNLESEFEDLKKSFIASSSSSSDEEINELSATVSSLSTQVTALSSQLNSEIADVNSQISDLSSQHSTDIDSLSSEISSATAQVSTLSSQVTTIASEVSSIDDNAVHKSGDETISGTKTFTSDVYVNSEKVLYGLYQHSVVIKRTVGNSISFSIINSSSTAMTTTSEIAKWLYNNGFISNLTLFPATGNYYTGTAGSQYVVNGVYSSNGSSVTGRYHTGAAEGFTTYSGWTVYDIVLALSEI